MRSFECSMATMTSLSLFSNFSVTPAGRQSMNGVNGLPSASAAFEQSSIRYEMVFFQPPFVYLRPARLPNTSSFWASLLQVIANASSMILRRVSLHLIVPVRRVGFVVLYLRSI